MPLGSVVIVIVPYVVMLGTIKVDVSVLLAELYSDKEVQSKSDEAPSCGMVAELLEEEEFPMALINSAVVVDGVFVNEVEAWEEEVALCC
jgi:hypothetical protein